MVTRRQTFYLKQKEIEMKNVFRPFGQKQKCIVLNFVQYRIKVVNHDSSLTTVFFLGIILKDKSVVRQTTGSIHLKILTKRDNFGFLPNKSICRQKKLI